MHNARTSAPTAGAAAAVSLPATSAIPDAAHETCTADDYDRYFGLAHDAPDLLEWSRTCLSLQRRLLDDLDGTGLDAEDRCRLLMGLVTVGELTLQRWIAVADRGPDAARS